jgi:NADH-quinone oxidoreductase subunit G
MSAKPETAVELLNVEIDGVPLQGPKGSMIIELADEAGIYIPRFCYHKKLPIAANCRMCLVQVEKVPKPLPACATPIAEGMKVYTRSEKALAAQRAVMEFLLINHPLDCPICDQGGECELQDLSLGYGRSISRFTEKKRVVPDKNIGPLIATDMTRCIHCTRCIRVLDVIAGERELGGMARGENLEVGPYIEKAIGSELSGNVIDVCPVGALTSKPFRFKARAWELIQHDTVAPHDPVGSNLHVHTRGSQVMRVVPRENEAINEVWLSDRDRFSYQGLYSEDRLRAPMIKEDGVWVESDWDGALNAVVLGLRGVLSAHGPEQIGWLASATATLEELYLFARLARGFGCNNIDHRLRQGDFSDDEQAPLFPWLGQSLRDLEHSDTVLLVGSNVRKEQPIVSHRLRKAFLRGAKMMAVNPRDFDFIFNVEARVVADPPGMVAGLAGVAKALLAARKRKMPDAVRGLLEGVKPDAEQRRIAEMLKGASAGTVLLGNLAAASPHFATLRALAGIIAETSGARLGYLTEGGNSAGAWLAGVLPHRGPAGERVDETGLDAGSQFAQARKAYVLLGLEPELDAADPVAARAALEDADFVVALAPFANENMKQHAHVLLPTACFPETSGTFVNAEGIWQSFKGCVAPVGEGRPAWKVLRVLGNLLGLNGFEYNSSEEVRDELRAKAEALRPDNTVKLDRTLETPAQTSGLQRIGGVPPYALDALVRRAPALQQTPDGQTSSWVYLSSAEARRLGLEEADRVTVRQNGREAVLPLMLDDGVPEGCVWVPAGVEATADLGPCCGTVELEKA